ncbi:MAG: right-handed parallel beta-helix repeat-containing protein [Paludibacter sp.]|nr:right-handed parallel beta-helix repeat-containing protein [Paludibacter sp.]
MEAGDAIFLSPDGSHSNQKQINKALKNGDVYLTQGVYEVDGPVYIKSNRVLLGHPDAIIRVWSGSSQWFTGRTGIISCKESLKNVEIAGFQIDGNIGNLPSSYANSRPGREHDCEKLINIGGYSNDFANNIKIHDMKLYNAFSDAIYIIYSKNVKVYDNFISNCQHEGIYLSVVQGGHICNNQIAGITSDCARLDNCEKCLIEHNLFFSYGGNSYGAYKGGQNGLQIGDAGSSKGYNATKKGYPTKNIEVRFNTFADPGLKAIWLHGGENVYIHDNEFVDAAVLETMGVPVGGISTDYQPTVGDSERAFSGILDIIRRASSFSYPVIKTDLKANATVTYQNNDVQPYSLVDVQGENIQVVKYEYAGTETKHFIERNVWTNASSHVGSALYIPGHFKTEDLKITVYSEAGYQVVEEIDVQEVVLEASIDPNLFVFLAVFAILGILVSRNLRRLS